MIIGNSKFEVVNKNGNLFVKHTFNGKNYDNEDYMKIYGIGDKPYIKRMSAKMYLPKELLEEIF